MTAQDRTGLPDNPTRPRRRACLGVVLLSGLAIASAPVLAAGAPVLAAGAPVLAAGAPAGGAATSQVAAAPTPADPDSGNVIFRVVPATPTPPPTQPPTPAPTPSGGHLPVTGGSPVPGWLATLGALLVLGGGLAVTVARRSRRTSPDPTGQR